MQVAATRRSGPVLLSPIPDQPGPLRCIIGISQKPVASTFNNDTVEHGNLTRFSARAPPPNAISVAVSVAATRKREISGL
jgi:hypothetical protein